MKRILTAAQMKQADRNTIETMGVPSLVLMERAALSCVEELQKKPERYYDMILMDIRK